MNPYGKIMNPKTGNIINITSRQGKSLLNNYVKQLQGGGLYPRRATPPPGKQTGFHGHKVGRPSKRRAESVEKRFLEKRRNRGCKYVSKAKVGKSKGSRCVLTQSGKMSRQCTLNQKTKRCVKKSTQKGGVNFLSSFFKPDCNTFPDLNLPTDYNQITAISSDKKKIEEYGDLIWRWINNCEDKGNKNIDRTLVDKINLFNKYFTTKENIYNTQIDDATMPEQRAFYDYDYVDKIKFKKKINDQIKSYIQEYYVKESQS